jgi:CheY-specific phosphatase CheX
VSEVTSCLADVVQQSCIALFSHYQVAITPSERMPSREVALCGIIGFTGDDLKGSLMLACSREPLELAQAGGDLTMRDWLAELTNQLIGRVKNRLLAFGTVIYCSTPVVLGGERIAPIESQPLGHLFTADGGVVSVWFDTVIRPGFALSPPGDVSELAQEGDTLLFGACRPRRPP